MTALSQWLEDHKQELIETYKKLHMQPELGFEEHKTSAYLAEELRTLGFEVQDKIGGTGVLGTLKGKDPGVTLALRADMDALPMPEESGLPFASTVPNVSHACGHDSHCTMVLYAAKAIVANGGIKRGTLKVLFQPGEETLRGALSVIEADVLKGIDEMVGIHVRSKKEVPVGEASPAIWHGATWKLHVKIHGLSSHGAWPQLGTNAMDVMAAVIMAVNSIRVDPRVNHSIKATWGRSSGTTFNIIPEFAELFFDVRAQNNEVSNDLITKAKRACEGAASSLGAKVDFIVEGGIPAADLNAELTEDARQAIEAVLGKAMPQVITPGGEDFHFYSTKLGIKTAFIGLGADTNTGVHTTTMWLNLDALPIGSKIMAQMVSKKLMY